MNEDLITGKAGTLVAAAFQTVGQFYQSKFLDIIVDNAGISVGAFLYLIAAIVAVSSVALGGNYRFWSWFLVGPGLFWFVVTNRVDAQYTQWQFGSREHKTEVVEWTVRELDPASEFQDDFIDNRVTKEPARVSWLYARWDHLTSSVVHTIISKLPIFRLQTDMRFLRQSQRYHILYNMSIDNNELSRLISRLVFTPQCTQYLALAMTKHQSPAVLDPNEYLTRMTALESAIIYTDQSPVIRDLRSYLDPTKFASALSGIPGVGEALSGVMGAISTFSQFASAFQGLLGGNTQSGMLLAMTNKTFTCKDLWMISVDLLAAHADLRTEKLAIQDVVLDEDFDAPQEDPDLTLALLARKFGDENCDVDTEGDIFGDQCLEDARTYMHRTIAMSMIQSMMTAINPHQLQGSLSFAGAAGLRNSGYSGVGSNLRYQAVQDEYESKGAYLAYAWALPHLQGMLYFFLALSFPFFAFTLLIPGRQWTLGTWMSLWLWAKSWDLGYAMVMVADQLLYHLLPRGPGMTNEVIYDPAEAFFFYFRQTPNVSMATYYTILAGLLAAIPIITGAFIRGGARQLSGMVRGFAGSNIGQLGSAMAQSRKQANEKYGQQLATALNNDLKQATGGLAGNTPGTTPTTSPTQGTSLAQGALKSSGYNPLSAAPPPQQAQQPSSGQPAAPTSSPPQQSSPSTKALPSTILPSSGKTNEGGYNDR